MTNKKAQSTIPVLTGLLSFAAVFVSLILLTSISGDVTETLQDNQFKTTSQPNESITLFNSTPSNLGFSDVVNDASLVVSNKTHVLASANYTVNALNGTIQLKSTVPQTGVFNNTIWNVTYTRNILKLSGNVSDQGMLGIDKASSFYSQIGLIAGVVALVSVLVGGFLFYVRRFY